MRIVSGAFGGRKLAAPKSDAIRPTGDRVRESLFNILAGYFDFSGLRVLDLFAGTGALGFEALSRGACYVHFVENSVKARALIRTNAETLGVTGHCRIYRRDATNLGAIGTLAPFDLAFLDPPYGKSLAPAAIRQMIEGNWLRDYSSEPDGSPPIRIVVEEKTGKFSAADISALDGVTEIERRRFGDSEIVFLSC